MDTRATDTTNETARLVLHATELFNAGDVEGFVACFHPEAEMHDVPEIPDSDVYRGRDGIRRWVAKVLDAGELRFELGDVVEGERLVAIATRAMARGRGSGVETEWAFTTVWGSRDGLINYHHGYSDHADALEAIGK